MMFVHSWPMDWHGLCHINQWHLTNNQRPLSKQLELHQLCHWDAQRSALSLGPPANLHLWTRSPLPHNRKWTTKARSNLGWSWLEPLVDTSIASQPTHRFSSLKPAMSCDGRDTRYIRCGHALHRYGSSRFPIASQSPGNFFLNTSICLRGLACEYIRS